MQNEFEEGKMKNGSNYLCSCLLSCLKLPVVWLDFLRKLTVGHQGGEFSWKVGLLVAATMIAASKEA